MNYHLLRWFNYTRLQNSNQQIHGEIPQSWIKMRRGRRFKSSPARYTKSSSIMLCEFRYHPTFSRRLSFETIRVPLIISTARMKRGILINNGHLTLQRGASTLHQTIVGPVRTTQIEDTRSKISATPVW